MKITNYFNQDELFLKSVLVSESRDHMMYMVIALENLLQQYEADLKNIRLLDPRENFLQIHMKIEEINTLNKMIDSFEEKNIRKVFEKDE